ncbi:2Fe-2S iron-sulfur cluster binding domain-containing protein [Hydrogenophaga taeniospiralis]|uniref:2Fe-2S iron-sulfur cluster-binding protein n=1 Tax=Hydrogenophaga taeniospiralis TaxID=65656 RepID=UPI001CFACDCF|nr:2Fe-2S iron-sulfur cluster-binding protein [Hydrogenophaga taeniospiralis]MCB4364749.1 2Fe-2S iron-sulfur cluster binding domain-containing protein [Hydrogenophaga taeniospiralis]
MSTPPQPTVFQLHLPETGQTLAARADDTLLQTLLRAGVAWPASCRNGSCRACIGRLLRGSVRYGIEWPGLLPEEKAAGCVLPCAAYPLEDVTLIGPGD